MIADLILHNIGTLVTGKELEKKDEKDMENIEVLENGYLAIKDGKILSVGEGEYPKELQNEKTELIDVNGKVITPGIIDSHTHLVHYGSRENELPLKIKGVPYLEILKQGGGILSTVRNTRKAMEKELYDKAYDVLNRMAKFGVTTVESKSGYGLDLENELKQLEVNKKLNENHPLDLVSTFLGAHAVPEEYIGNTKGYIDEVIKMLKVVKEKNLAEFCDIFCEDSVFDVAESRHILNEAKKEGFKLRIHADEIVSLGGAELAGEIGAVSAEHLMAVSDEGIKELAKNNVIANILPATSFNLGKNYAPVRKMINEGVTVALSTDYNPGSCPCENIQLVMNIASAQIKMTPIEIIKATTINAAKVVCRENEIGSLEVGKKADLVIYDVNNLNYIFYNIGINHVNDVFKEGKQIVKNKELCF